MYVIIFTDLEKQEQKKIDSAPYQMEANELCLIYAERYVVAKEGIKYMIKPLWKKSEIIKHGYYITQGKADFNKKYCIFKKEKNGFLYTGELKKVGYFQVFKTSYESLEAKRKEHVLYFETKPLLTDIENKNHKLFILDPPQTQQEGV